MKNYKERLIEKLTNEYFDRVFCSESGVHLPLAYFISEWENYYKEDIIHQVLCNIKSVSKDGLTKPNYNEFNSLITNNNN